MGNFRSVVLALGAAATLMGTAARAEVAQIRISKQPGIVFLPAILMEEKHLIEKQAAALGIKDLKVDWTLLTSGGTSVDSLLAGNLDFVTSGVSNLLLIWAKTNGGVKALGGVVGLPLRLVTRNPDVRTLKDFSPKDRIAVPTLRVSMQSVILGIALDQAFGPGSNSKLDAIQVQLGHPDATLAILNPLHEVDSHFSAPPFAQVELKTPGVHEVLNSTEVLGGPAHITTVFATQKFVDANPLVAKAVLAALDEADEMIARDPADAAQAYLVNTKEKLEASVLISLIKEPGAIFTATPERTMVYAEQMYKTGLIKKKPESWKDYFFAPIHERAGS